MTWPSFSRRGKEQGDSFQWNNSNVLGTLQQQQIRFKSNPIELIFEENYFSPNSSQLTKANETD